MHFRLRADGRWEELHHDGEGGEGRGHHPAPLQGSLREDHRRQLPRLTVLGGGACNQERIEFIIEIEIFWKAYRQKRLKKGV